jgi:Domain of Unknown Function with PDB structure (DUF3857)/Domain of Unknown Function with PDB structure (DUF3858)
LLFASLVLAGHRGFAQDKSPVVFGKVTAADFAISLPAEDTAADAVVISDVGIKSFQQRGFSVFRWDGNLQRTKRILILKKRGFEAATVTIPLEVFKSESEEVTDLKAATYNLEGGKVVKTELDKKGVFKIKVSENWTAERFTFPAVREGSILEYTYTQTSPFVLNNHSWMLQSIYPCLWSEFKASIPPVFSYSIANSSALPFCIETIGEEQVMIGQIYGEEKTFHWAVRNVPALEVEPFTTAINNYLERVDVRISGFEERNVAAVRNFRTNQTTYQVQDVRAGGVLYSWVQLDRQLLETDHFGADLAASNSWLDQDMKEITAGMADDLGKARKIYAYVRDHFTCDTHPGYLMTNTLKAVYKARSGSEAELNLLLAAMLIHEKLNAVAVLLSTRSNGFINELMPQPSQLNYTVCKLRVGEVSYYLDASDPNSGFGQLPLECYNGLDIVVDTTTRHPEDALSADSVTEKKKVTVFLSNGDKGGLDGSVQDFPGLAEAAEIRKKIKEQDGEKKFLEQLRSGSAAEETISDLEIDSLRLPDEPLAINYSCHLATDSASDVFYFTPMLADRITENPFRASERHYPVEMPYAKDVNYILAMDIPSGYTVDALPESAKITLNDGGYFEYILSQDGDQIHFRTRMRLMKANYQPQEYVLLRNFFAAVVDKESEQIVFKKKK